jgi:hypothetical protein
MRSNGDKRTAPTVAATRSRRTRKLTGVIAIAALVVATLGAVMHTAGAASDPPSTYSGSHLTPRQAMEYAYAAGFHTQQQLVTVTAIGMAESGLVTGTRNWHPEFGYRPASDAIGVQGPASVWNGSRQMHSDRGVWQISSHFWPQYTDAQTDNPASAAKLMWAISNHGTDFTPWNTFTGGNSNSYTSSLGPIAKAVIADGGGSPAATPTPKPATPPTKPKPKPPVTQPKPHVTQPKPHVTVPDRAAPDADHSGYGHSWHHHRRHHHRHHDWNGWDNDGRWNHHSDDDGGRWSSSSRCHR